VPKFALRAARGERLPVHGSGAATRSYLHVDDVAEAFDLILHKASQGWWLGERGGQGCRTRLAGDEP
jgi:dTDP-D-glucose 4,6-dehydratase